MKSILISAIFCFFVTSCNRRPSFSHFKMKSESNLYVSDKVLTKQRNLNPKYYVVISNEKGTINQGSNWDIKVKIIREPKSETITVLLTRDNFFECTWGPRSLGKRDDLAVQLPIINDGQTFRIEVSDLNKILPNIIEVNLMETTF